VGQVKKGDIILHYRKQKKGIVAVSRAKEDGRYLEHISHPGVDFGDGWQFLANYHMLKSPISRDAVNREILKLELPDSPILPNGNVRFAYFIPFDIKGLRIVRRASDEEWPDWIDKELNFPGADDLDDTNGEEGFLEGGRQIAVSTVRSDRLREAAKQKQGLNCYCCGFNFEQFYGTIAHDKAIVHHRETFDGRTRKSTVDDVRVVCANCHYVIHLKKPPIDVDELKSLISHSWVRWTHQGIRRKG
jgi:hypothetical protein